VLDLSLLEAVTALRVGGEVQGVEVSARVAALDGVKLSVTEHLNSEHGKTFDPAKLCQGEGELEAKVGRAIELNLSSINPVI